MKKLSKLNINSEKLINNEDLKTLRGGEYGVLICNGSGSNCTLKIAEGWGCGTFQDMLAACNIGCPGTTMPVCFY